MNNKIPIVTMPRKVYFYANDSVYTFKFRAKTQQYRLVEVTDFTVDFIEIDDKIDPALFYKVGMFFTQSSTELLDMEVPECLPPRLNYIVNYWYTKNTYIF